MYVVVKKAVQRVKGNSSTLAVVGAATRKAPAMATSIQYQRPCLGCRQRVPGGPGGRWDETSTGQLDSDGDGDGDERPTWMQRRARVVGGSRWRACAVRCGVVWCAASGCACVQCSS